MLEVAVDGSWKSTDTISGLEEGYPRLGAGGLPVERERADALWELLTVGETIARGSNGRSRCPTHYTANGHVFLGLLEVLGLSLWLSLCSTVGGLCGPPKF